MEIENLTELKILGLAKKLAYEMAKEQYEKAKAIEQQAEAEALTKYNNQNNTSFEDSCLIVENKENFNNYLLILQNEYKKLDISNELDKVYSYEFFKKFITAEKQYLLVACDFLALFGKTEESEQLKQALNGYIKEDHKQQLIKLNDKFLGIEA